MSKRLPLDRRRDDGGIRPPNQWSRTMTQYMLSVHVASSGDRAPLTEEQQREGFATVAALEAEMETAGAFVFSARLSEPADARVVRRTGGRTRSTDGPYAETKELLGGFYLIDAPDLDAALDWASRVSGAIGEAIEVRRLAGSRAATPALRR
jgi:hypothetical protein